MKILLIFLLFVPFSAFTESILDEYESNVPSKEMTCWTGQTGNKIYGIVNNEIVVDRMYKIPILERKGSVFAGKGDTFIGEITLILDYQRKQVTQLLAGLREVFDCY